MNNMNKKRKTNPPAKQTLAKPKSTSPASLTQVTHQLLSTGPIPPPEILQGYEQILPGSAERILVMAEEDAKHEHALEKSALHLASEEIKRGQLYGLIIGILAFVTSIIALALGSEKAAITLGGTTVVGLVAVFVIGHLKKFGSPSMKNGDD
ncbi:MAG: hypothetical protein DRR16_03435 [Candidatus Parabeggiatoa sp. nov. 3]|nr:MAG: hypothetical protein DRQ99_31880 [Gammaproteobacteria bacterium]RKZ89065.1 MAG: hypothetical protein DRR16_03435 [Gammaproteobacteria bacterium]HEW97243.1 DUF2335 domain-containing protein [Beggiatoa sp.]